MAASIIEKGYRETTVADVVRLARTSRRSFYEHFEDRDACFLALFDATNDAMMEEIAAAVHPDQTLDEQVDAALDAYIDNVAQRPAVWGRPAPNGAWPRWSGSPRCWWRWSSQGAPYSRRSPPGRWPWTPRSSSSAVSESWR
jgi:AcrR family transcriptional regulator